MQDHYYQEHPEQQQYAAQAYQEPPLDPAMERVRRKMIRLLIISIGIMVIGLIAVLSAVVYKINQAPDTAESETAQSDIPGQSPGADIPGQAVKKDAQAQNTENKAAELPPMVESQLELAPGTRLLSQSLSGNLVSLETLLPDGGTEIMIYDYRQSRFVGRMRLGNLE
jgi:cytoskeletal protein RodZ